MRVLTALVLGGILAASSGSSYASQAGKTATSDPVEAEPVVSFQFARAGVQVPRYTIEVRADGTGSYQADAMAGVSSESMPVSATQHVSRTIALTHATAAKIFKTAHELKHFNIECASKVKNIADTGTKTLSYAGADGKGSCVYNYSENKDVDSLTDTFLGIAFTLDEGRRLAFLHRYDRLGLDAEMDMLTDEAKAGRALELDTIAPVLTSIASDTAVIERVRLRAAKLLEQAREK